jgi:hypothetical protein
MAKFDPTVDLTGRKFGRLTVLSQNKKPDKGGYPTWNCSCECGGFSSPTGPNLVYGNSTSCGCIRREAAISRLASMSENNRLPAGEAAFNQVLSNYRVNARNRGLEFSLTEEEFRTLTKITCHYCGRLPNQQKKTRDRKRRVRDIYVFMGIDRKDNKQGYTTSNSVPCCLFCNQAKLTHSYEEFQAWLADIQDFRNSWPQPKVEKTNERCF